MTTKSLVKSKMGLQRATSIVPYLTPEEVYRMADAALDNRNGERDKLLILLLFETGLRVSEALSLTPRLIAQHNSKPVIHLKKGKGNKTRMVACPEDLAHRIRSFAYSKEIGIDDRIFPINRKRAWQIVKLAGEKASIQKRVWPHLLRHSDAIERLRQTGNPKALQLHLGHSSALMTMRYLATLTAEDVLRIQQQVEFGRPERY
jgi:integrase/recombinase XerD